MPVFRTLLASLLIIAGGVATLAFATNGFRTFTSESARRLAVQMHPREVPQVALQASDGRTVNFRQLRGRWVLVDFIYTRCMTYCSVQGNEFARLQRRLAKPIADGRVVLLSISFDPAHDGPAELAGYQHRSHSHGAGWIAVRPVDESGLKSLTQIFGVTVIPDGVGGYIHNAAIAVVSPSGRLVDIVDWNDPQAAERFVMQGGG